MIDASPDDGGGGRAATANTQSGAAGNVVQARDIHGDVRLDTPPQRRSWAPAAVLAVAVIVAALIIAWPRSSDDPATGAPPELGVVVDMSHNDQAPWGYVSESPDFPGSALVDRLAEPMAALDRDLVREIRTSDGAISLHRHLIRLHLIGPVGGTRVTDIRPVIRRTAPPPSGSLVHVPPQGSEESSEVLLLLDEGFPVLQSSEPMPSPPPGEAGRRIPTGPYFPRHTINLAAGETHEVVLTTIARSRSYEYDLAITHQTGTEIRETVVDDNGQPFRVAGRSCSSEHVASYQAAYRLVTGLSVVAEFDPARIDLSPILC
ncbi:hypothetical protein [Saccharothrix luteola]|uniref:hypothetical protein n=1 Tax=Saccharothrix luteola TaxID=2893018 RepID=UPI001E63687B|nr:hypothetical protein [Saccharothrix luteola]MCC8246748.1 hypothetical protein [Saccharothrix luteola]